MIKNILLILIFTVFTFNINVVFAKENYKHNFAFFCKSYNKDLNKSLKLYQSFENLAEEKYPFYIIVPTKEITLFKNSFNKLKKEKKITNIPNFLTEEEILKTCKIYDRIYKGPKHFQKGWFVQQMVKMCISTSNLAKDYITLDSDVYFVKKINKNLFYKNGYLKLVGRKIGDNKKAIKFFNLKNSPEEDKHRYETASFVRYLFRPDEESGNEDNLIFYDFVSHYALWDSDIMKEMLGYVKKKIDFDFYDLIKTNPWEMQWYGQFIQSKHIERFNLMDANFHLTLGYENERKKHFRCHPENGYKNNYLIANQSEDGYKMPNTLFCKIKSKFNYIDITYIRKFLWEYVY